MSDDEKMVEQHRVWEDWAQADPLWAILSDPSRKGRKWESELDEFFASGTNDINIVLTQLRERGLDPKRGRCLDFGCGIGRLTQALLAEFDSADGVDISETMIELANEHNKFGERCRYHVNGEPDLSLFADGTFDFVFTTIVLQHNPPDVAASYIREFLRILQPGGVTVFDMPAHPRGSELAQGSHRASISLGSAPDTLVPGEAATLKVVVGNVSDTDWPPASRLSLGNHWRSSDGSKMLIQDDGRTGMPNGLQAGATTEIGLQVTAPKKGGRFQLEVDLVEDGVCWFHDTGSPTAIHPVSVRSPRSGRFSLRRGRAPEAVPVTESEFDEPKPFAMNGLEREEVEQVVAGAGGEVLDVIESGSGGDHWDGFRYFVRLPEAP